MFAAIVVLTLFWNFNLFRLTFCKMFLVKGFNGSATQPLLFIKPLVFYSRLYIAVILGPFVILNFVAAILAREAWRSNQFQMTMVEVCILSAVFPIAIFYE